MSCGQSRRHLLSLQALRGSESTWVECVKCHKWRFLADVSDPTQLPSNWSCHMNKDVSRGSCDSPEDTVPESEEPKIIYNKYAGGSLVWAKVPGYPWWPAMVDDDPELGEFFWTIDHEDTEGNQTPTQYHVVFLDEKVSRAWLRVADLRPFNELTSVTSMGPFVMRGQNYLGRVEAAAERARSALYLTVKDRLQKFSFVTRFSGPWNKRRVDPSTDQDSVTSDDRPLIHSSKNKSKKRRSKTATGPKITSESSTKAGQHDQNSDEVSLNESPETYDDVLREAANLLASWSDLSENEEEDNLAAGSQTFANRGSTESTIQKPRGGKNKNVGQEKGDSDQIGCVTQSTEPTITKKSGKKRKNATEPTDPDFSADKEKSDSSKRRKGVSKKTGDATTTITKRKSSQQKVIKSISIGEAISCDGEAKNKPKFGSAVTKKKTKKPSDNQVVESMANCVPEEVKKSEGKAMVATKNSNTAGGDKVKPVFGVKKISKKSTLSSSVPDTQLSNEETMVGDGGLDQIIDDVALEKVLESQFVNEPLVRSTEE